MPYQTVDGQPVLGRQARGAGNVTQELATLLRIHHFCKNTEEGTENGALNCPNSKHNTEKELLLQAVSNGKNVMFS